jgi:hypothetical protein
MNVIGFDDGPFAHEHRGDVLLIGVVCAKTRLDGIVSGCIRRDGSNSTRTMIDLVRRSQFVDHVQAVMLQGIAVGGFNVVDVHELSEALQVPVLVVTRRRANLDSVHRALFRDSPSGRPRVPGAAGKWRLIQRAGSIEPLGTSRRALRRAAATGVRVSNQRLFVQRVGLSLEQARQLVLATTLHGNLPEPLRLAHIIATGIVVGRSRGRA